MLTTRDLQVIEFLNEYKVATTSTIQHFFFPSLSMCHKRLKVMVDANEIKRIRNHINMEYVYYKKKPKQLRHSLMVTEFYRNFSKKHKVITFKLEPILGDIRPDSVFGYMNGQEKKLGLLEVELSNKGFNYLKYEKFYSSEAYKKFFPVMPTIFIYGKANIPSTVKCKYVLIPSAA